MDWRNRKAQRPPFHFTSAQARRVAIRRLGLKVGMLVELADGVLTSVVEIHGDKVRLAGSAVFITPNAIVRVVHH